MREASAQVRARARDKSLAPFSAAAVVALVDRVKIESGGLDFQGSYTQPTTKEPAYGGHASAMGPPPQAAPQASVISPVTFDEIPCISTKTYCPRILKTILARLETPKAAIRLLALSLSPRKMGFQSCVQCRPTGTVFIQITSL